MANKKKIKPRKIMITLFNEVIKECCTYIIEFDLGWEILDATLFEDLEIKRDESLVITDDTLKVKKIERKLLEMPDKKEH